MDIWASWCKPCIRSIPASLELSKTHKEDPFQVIFLGYKDEFEDWKTASKKLGLGPNTKSYLIPYDKSGEFKSLTDLTHIPRYILIGQSGEILEWKAFSASNLELQSVIRNKLNE